MQVIIGCRIRCTYCELISICIDDKQKSRGTLGKGGLKAGNEDDIIHTSKTNTHHPWEVHCGGRRTCRNTPIILGVSFPQIDPLKSARRNVAELQGLAEPEEYVPEEDENEHPSRGRECLEEDSI